MEINNNLTVTRGEGEEGNGGKKGEGLQSRWNNRETQLASSHNHIKITTV